MLHFSSELPQPLFPLDFGIHTFDPRRQIKINNKTGKSRQSILLKSNLNENDSVQDVVGHFPHSMALTQP